jgi:hypothetical protein
MKRLSSRPRDERRAAAEGHKNFVLFSVRHHWLCFAEFGLGSGFVCSARVVGWYPVSRDGLGNGFVRRKSWGRPTTGNAMGLFCRIGAGTGFVWLSAPVADADCRSRGRSRSGFVRAKTRTRPIPGNGLALFCRLRWSIGFVWVFGRGMLPRTGWPASRTSMRTSPAGRVQVISC